MNDLICSIIEVFEDFLEEKGIVIENPEKDEAIADGEDADCIANIYGSDYGILEDEILNLLKEN